MPRRRQAPAGPRRSAVPCRPIRCASHPLGSRRPLSPLAGALASPRPVIPPSPVPGMPGDGCPSCQRRRRWLPAVTIAPQLFSTLRGMKATIEVTGLRKRFGRTVALDGLSFTVTPGDVTGFVGPNGAGKSTTMRVILGLDAADEGGALLDAAALQPSRTARNHLLWLAHSQGLTARRVDEVTELVGLQTAARRKAGGYSLGMRQRLGIAAAMLGDPPVLMLDEPFNGLDPEGIVWMRGFLRSLAAEGRGVLVSSHLMSELQDTASHLVVIGRGRLVADTSVADLIAAASSGRVTLRTAARSEAMTVLAHAGATVADTDHDTFTVSGLAAELVVLLLGESAVPFSEVSAHHATLEEAYMELTRETVEFRAAAGEAAR